MLFPIIGNSENDNKLPLQQICEMNDVFLYVKPNESRFWMTYIPQRVVDEATGTLMVRDEHRKRDIKKITLSDIDPKNILWAKYERVNQLTRDDVKKVLKINRDGTVKVIMSKEKGGKECILQRGCLINLRSYFEKVCLETLSKSNQRRMNISIDRK